MSSLFYLDLFTAIVASLLGGLLPLAQSAARHYFKKNPSAIESFKSPAGEALLRMIGVDVKEPPSGKVLFAELSRTSGEMDRIVRQIEKFAEERHANLAELEQQLEHLGRQEEELKQRVEGLKNVPLPAAQYFAELVDKGERKSARRDYIIFLLGVIVSALVSILLRWVGWA